MSERPVAFITGAAHGQGRAVALALAAAGHDVAALDVAAPLEYPGLVGLPATFGKTDSYFAISSGNASCPPSGRISSGMPSRTATESASEPRVTPAM